MSEETREPNWVKCGKCSHIWIGAYLPMEMTTFAKLLKSLRCPNCGNGPKQVFMAKQKSGKLLEPLAKHQIEGESHGARKEHA